MKTDPIADMLTRIRNGAAAGKQTVSIPHSKIKEAIAGILKQHGYIVNFKTVSPVNFPMIEVELGQASSDLTLVRVSKPGRRIYSSSKEIPRVLGGRGIVIISTPSGLMSGQEARKKGLGGELICKVY